MPNGMILQLCQQMDIQSPTPTDPHRTVKEWRPVGDKVTINGNKVPFGFIPDFRIIGNFTPDGRR